MGFRDLPAENQADSRTSRLGGEKRHEQVGSVGKSRTFVLDGNFELRALTFPGDRYRSPVSSDASTALRSKLIITCSS